jgi:hypothetical protein
VSFSPSIGPYSPQIVILKSNWLLVKKIRFSCGTIDLSAKQNFRRLAFRKKFISPLFQNMFVILAYVLGANIFCSVTFSAENFYYNSRDRMAMQNRTVRTGLPRQDG